MAAQYSTRKTVSLLIGPDTSSIGMGSGLFDRGRILHHLGWVVSLLIGPDTIFTRMGSVAS